MSFFQDYDFRLAIEKGEVPGHSFRRIVAKNPATQTNVAREDVWGGSGNLVWATAPETLEIVSDSANDNAAGTGAQIALVETLDASLSTQNIIVPLNGLTPVVLAGTHLRVNGLVIVSAGSSTTNEGTVTVQVSGGGNVRKVALPGISAAQDCHYTTPANTTLYTQQVITVVPGNENASFITKLKQFQNPNFVEYVGVEFPIYQNTIVFPTLAPFRSDAGTDFTVQTLTSNINTEINYVVEAILIEDGF